MRRALRDRGRRTSGRRARPVAGPAYRPAGNRPRRPGPRADRPTRRAPARAGPRRRQRRARHRGGGPRADRDHDRCGATGRGPTGRHGVASCPVPRARWTADRCGRVGFRPGRRGGRRGARRQGPHDRLDVARGDRPEHRHDQHVRRGQGGELVGHRGVADGQPGDDDRELPAGDQRRPGAGPAHPPDPCALRRPPARRVLGRGRRHGEHDRPAEHRRDRPRVGVEAEHHEEHRGEQVAQRLEQLRRVLRGGAGDRDAQQERAHRGGHLQRRGEPGDQQRGAEHLEQEHLAVVGVDDRRDEAAVAQGDDQHHRDHRERHRDRTDPAPQRHAEQQRGEDRQVERHHQVLEDQDRQHHRRLPVAEPAQVRQHLRDDPGRGDVGDPAQHHRPDRAPAQDQRDRDAGRGVEHDVQDPGRPGPLQPGDQLDRGVLEPEQQEQQDDADLAGQRGEVADVAQRDDSARPEREATEQVERDGGQADPLRESAEQAEPEEDGAEFEQFECGDVGRRRRRDHLARAHDRDHRHLGAGAQRGVAERAAVERAVELDRHLAGGDAREVRVLVLQLVDQLRGAEQVRQGARLLGGQRQLRDAGVRVVGTGEDQVDLPVAVRDDPDPAAAAQLDLLPHPDPGQRRHVDVHPRNAEDHAFGSAPARDRAVRRDRRPRQAQALPGSAPPAERGAPPRGLPGHRVRPALARLRRRVPRPHPRCPVRRHRLGRLRAAAELRRLRRRRRRRPRRRGAARGEGPRLRRRAPARLSLRAADRDDPDGRDAGGDRHRRAFPAGAGEAVRHRPGVREGAQRRAQGGLPRAGHLPHRPLPRQGVGAEHPRAALRQRAVRADLEPPEHPLRADRRARGDRHRGPGVVHGVHRHVPGHDLHPPVPDPRLRGVGAAVRDRTGRAARGEGEGLPLVRPLDPSRVVFGQYDGYRDEDGVADDSDVETFVAIETYVDNWRWFGVPFFLRTGKAMGATRRTVTIGFAEPALTMFPGGSFTGDAHDGPPTELVIELADQVSAELDVRAKVPGPELKVGRGRMRLDLDSVGDPDDALEAYERLLLDVMKGDPTLATPTGPGARRTRSTCPARAAGGCRSEPLAQRALPPDRRARDHRRPALGGARRHRRHRRLVLPGPVRRAQRVRLAARRRPRRPLEARAVRRRDRARQPAAVLLPRLHHPHHPLPHLRRHRRGAGLHVAATPARPGPPPAPGPPGHRRARLGADGGRGRAPARLRPRDPEGRDRRGGHPVHRQRRHAGPDLLGGAGGHRPRGGRAVPHRRGAHRGVRPGGGRDRGAHHLRRRRGGPVHRDRLVLEGLAGALVVHRALARTRAPLRAHAEAAHPRADRGRHRVTDDGAARAARRRAELGLPLRLDARRRVHPLRAAAARVHRGGGRVHRLAVGPVREHPGRGPGPAARHVHDRRRRDPRRGRARPPRRLSRVAAGAGRQRRGGPAAARHLRRDHRLGLPVRQVRRRRLPRRLDEPLRDPRLAARALGPAGRGDLGDPRRPPGPRVLPADVLGRARADDPDGAPARPARRRRGLDHHPRRDLPPDHGPRLGRRARLVRAALRRDHARRVGAAHADGEVLRADRAAVPGHPGRDQRRPRRRHAGVPLRRGGLAGRPRRRGGHVLDVLVLERRGDDPGRTPGARPDRAGEDVLLRQPPGPLRRGDRPDR
ncbi:hypothetical protein L7F22_008605 [Adiantum nelumboides]|nr:hypothetical protein [Adiantum nelumboides]